jgi:hypothetical protein
MQRLREGSFPESLTHCDDHARLRDGLDVGAAPKLR